MLFKDREFGPGEVVTLDFNDFENCVFDGCKIQYHGLGRYTLQGVRFGVVEIGFMSAAAKTLDFLTFMVAADQGAGVEKVFENIRRMGYEKAASASTPHELPEDDE